jgi:hypothetical protein
VPAVVTIDMEATKETVGITIIAMSVMIFKGKENVTGVIDASLVMIKVIQGIIEDKAKEDKGIIKAVVYVVTGNNRAHVTNIHIHLKFYIILGDYGDRCRFKHGNQNN